MAKASDLQRYLNNNGIPYTIPSPPSPMYPSGSF